jgi:hypothetical protein
MGTERVIAMSRDESRQKLACEFSATDIVTERGDGGGRKELVESDADNPACGLELAFHDKAHGHRSGMPTAPASSGNCQVLMNQGDDSRAFPDRGTYALD